MTAKDWIALVQALGSLALVGVAIVTLKRASVTLLQPIRTEIFKVQFEELRALLQLFARKDELELREEIGFNELVEFNAVRIHDLFFHDVYGISVNESERPYSSKNCPISIVNGEFLASSTNGRAVISPGQQVAITRPKPGQAVDARKWWLNFKLGDIFVPSKLSSFTERLRSDASSPLLPESVSQKLVDLLKTMNDNSTILFEVLSSAGRSLPERFSEAEPPQTITVAWIKDLYFSRLILLQPKTEAVVQSIHKYLAADKLLKPW